MSETHTCHEISSEYIFSIIHEIENSVPVQDWKINDVYVWPILRTAIRPVLFKKISHTKNILFYKKISSFIHSFFYFPWLKNFKIHDILMLSDNASDTYVEGMWYDKLLGPIYDDLKRNNKKVIVFSPTKNDLVPYYTQVTSFEFFNYFSIIASKVVTIFKSTKNSLEGYLVFIEILKKYGISEKLFSYKKIAGLAFKIDILKKIFINLLKKIKPEKCYIVSYYYHMGFAFNKACRELNIPTIEIQHGSQCGKHDAYNAWHAIPETGYPELPSLFWCWNQEDSQFINDWANKTNGAHGAFAGGHPWIDFWLSDTHKTVREYDKQIEILKNNNNILDVLVTLQPVGSFKQFWDMLAEIIESEHHKIRWWIRKHPTTSFHHKREGIENILKIHHKNVNLKEATEFPLYAWLRNVDLHITVRSGTAMEAKLFGVKTIFLSELAKNEYEELIKQGYAKVLTEKKDVLNHLKNLSW